MLRFWIASVILVVGQSVAVAGNADLEKCVADADGRTAQMYDCLTADLDKQDKALRLALEELLENQPEAKEWIDNAQQTWQRFVDTDCKMRGFLVGGSLGRLIGLECVRATTEERARLIKALVF